MTHACIRRHLKRLCARVCPLTANSHGPQKMHGIESKMVVESLCMQSDAYMHHMDYGDWLEKISLDELSRTRVYNPLLDDLLQQLLLCDGFCYCGNKHIIERNVPVVPTMRPSIYSCEVSIKNKPSIKSMAPETANSLNILLTHYHTWTIFV